MMSHKKMLKKMTYSRLRTTWNALLKHVGITAENLGEIMWSNTWRLTMLNEFFNIFRYYSPTIKEPKRAEVANVTLDQFRYNWVLRDHLESTNLKAADTLSTN